MTLFATRFLRHSVPIAAILVAVPCAACSKSHGMADEDEDASPPIRRDSAPPVLPDAGRDARMPPVVDAGPVCGDPRAIMPTSVCELRGESPSLTIRVDGCYCGETLGCDANVDGDTLRLTTTMCTPDFLCGACMPLETECELPDDYVAGTEYRVEINGRPAAVMRGELPATATERCWNPAPPVPDHLTGCDYPEETVEPTDSCIPSEVNTHEAVIVSVTGCESCFADAAGCAFASTVDGYRFVASQMRTCDCPACGACAPGCHPLTQTCTLPPLPAGTHVIEIGDRTEEVVASPSGTENRLCDATEG